METYIIETGQVAGLQHWVESKTSPRRNYQYTDASGTVRTIYRQGVTSHSEKGRYFLVLENKKELELPTGSWFSVRDGHKVSVALSTDPKHNGELIGCYNHITENFWYSRKFEKRNKVDKQMNNGKWAALLMAHIFLVPLTIILIIDKYKLSLGGELILSIFIAWFILLTLIIKSLQRAKRLHLEQLPDDDAIPTLKADLLKSKI